ncbi:MAG TPA: class I SAM-dependent methyltransferase [Bacteroidales bacterium]|nr:class I SAM-dependent methyltransferase [Bacteroidales bacterium]
MESDRLRWNEKHAAKTGKGEPDVFFLKHFKSLHPGRTLDLACGRGRHACFLAARGHHVTAVDISDVAIQYCRTSALEAGLTINLLRADLDNPADMFPQEHFHNVVCINFRPADALLQQLPDWLKPGGFFLWCSFNEIQASVSGFPEHLALHKEAFVQLPGLKCLVYERFEDHTGHRDAYLFIKP